VRAAVISDVHGNLAALKAVLDAVESEGADEIWCLGDLVGYGPEPQACYERVIERAAICLAGNHDLVVAGRIGIEVFAYDAADAAVWTQRVLSPELLEALGGLLPSGERDGVELYHASIRDPVWEYVLDDATARACMRLQESRVCLIGHSHVPLVFAELDGRTTGAAVDGDSTVSLSDGTFLLNPGSVGQPRDGDNRAAWLLLDLDTQTAAWRRVAYDIRRTQQAMLERGLPPRLAARLAEGH
jgi:predicted phosphodiesterase